MTAVDPLFAQWLMSPGYWQVSTDALLAARWGDRAQQTERMTTIATKAEAQAEAARQLAFLGGPLAIEEHLLVGEWSERLGQVITITIPQLGYDGGLDVFLLSAEDDRVAGTSRVTVIRRL